MSIFQGLYGYEQVMLGLGILLFLVLLFILLRCVVKDKPWGKVAGFFLLPILMIGFPSIQKLSYGLSPLVDVIEVTKKVIEGIYDGVTTSELDNLAAETADRKSVV